MEKLKIEGAKELYEIVNMFSDINILKNDKCKILKIDFNNKNNGD